MFIHLYVYAYIYICMYTYRNPFLGGTQRDVYVYSGYIHVFKHMYMFIDMYLYIYICVDVHMHIYSGACQVVVGGVCACARGYASVFGCV